MPWAVYNSNGKLLQSLVIADDSIVEGKLDVSNAPTNGYFLQAQSGEGGGLTWAAASSGPSQANQAALEARTNEDTYAPPDLMHHHPGVAKAWCRIAANGSLNSPSYNIASVSTSTGSRTIVFDTDFSGAVYSSTAALVTDSNQNTQLAYSSPAAGQIVCQIYNSGSLTDDRITAHAFFGDQ